MGRMLLLFAVEGDFSEGAVVLLKLDALRGVPNILFGVIPGGSGCLSAFENHLHSVFFLGHNVYLLLDGPRAYCGRACVLCDERGEYTLFLWPMHVSR